MNDAMTPERSQPVRLVVETKYQDLISVTVETLGLGTSEVEDGRPELGLSLLPLTSPVGDLDAVLAELRRRIAAEHGGWVPSLGKERDAFSTVMRGGHPKPTSLLLPEVPTDDDAAAAIVDTPAAVPPDAVRVGVVDTAVADLSDGGEAWRAHSAFVASIVRQAAPDVDLRSEPALSLDSGQGSTWDVADAIVKLAFVDRVQIVLLPLACFTADGQPPLLLERAIACLPPEVLVIAAAGNQIADDGWSPLGRGPRSAAWPAALAQVKAVSADFGTKVTPQPWVDALASKVQFVGPFFHGSVVVSVPGEELEEREFAGTARWRGTSFSAAYAAGLVAARMDAQTTAHAAWDALLADGTELAAPPPPVDRS